MAKIEIVEIDDIEYVVINNGNDEYTSMLKTTWEELEAAKLGKAL